jgi:hypothetical protein
MGSSSRIGAPDKEEEEEKKESPGAQTLIENRTKEVRRCLSHFIHFA